MSETIEAGEYELAAAQWDERTSEPGEPLVFTRHRKGDRVQLDTATARRLYAAGAVIKPGAAEQARAAQLMAELEVLKSQLTPEQLAALTGNGSEAAQAGSDPSGGAGGGSHSPERPSKAADKGAWVAYIVALELKTPEEAGKLTRDQLIELAPAE